MTTFERVQQILVDHLGVESSKITEHASIIDDLGADSLDVVEVLIAVEQEFDVDVDDSEWNDVLTVGDAVKLIDRLAVPA